MSDLRANNGRFLPIEVTKEYLIQRVEKFIKKDVGCWEWKGALNKGYGVLSVKNKLKQAHRISYEAFVGEIPNGLVLDHLCKNTRCVNPEHLEPVTQALNVARGDSGRYWSKKTHCPQGHEYSNENTYVSKMGRRSCRNCHNQRRTLAFKRSGIWI